MYVEKNRTTLTSMRPLSHVAHKWKKTRKTNLINIASLVEYFFHEYISMKIGEI